jgi:multicomponent Na+:H+ antiporter subunit D
MSALPEATTLVVVGPLLAGALIAGSSVTRVGRACADAFALVVAAAVTATAAWAAIDVGGGTTVVWPGDWPPVHGQPIGVALVVDRPAALLICLVGVLTLAALTYSSHILADTGAPYLVLVLMFLGACAGFVLSGDVFDAFVWFELMGVSAYALTGMRIEEPLSVHGALSFGIVNTVGASLSLTGLSLLYARTGELNLAAMGRALRDSAPADRLVLVSCALLLTGVLVKMAVVPFHFWTADAEAVAPTPVCVLLSGAMVTVGAFALARWWWVVFDGSVPSSAARHALIGFGAVTALVGAVMCATQRHLKRMLAYSTVAHSGVVTCGIGLLSASGLAAAGWYAAGQACTKGALFLLVGLLLHRFETLDEHELYGRGRQMRLAGGAFLLGGIALAGLPPFGTWAGKAALSTSFGESGVTWLEVVVLLVSVLTAGSVLRAGLRIFVGLGDVPDPGPDTHEEPESETPAPSDLLRTVVPPFLLLLIPAVSVFWAGLAHGVATAGASVADPSAYIGAVLSGTTLTEPPVDAAPLWTGASVGLGVLSACLSVAFAALMLWPGRLRSPGFARVRYRAAIRGLHEVHRAHIGDYVSWVLVGFAVLGAALLVGAG